MSNLGLVPSISSFDASLTNPLIQPHSLSISSPKQNSPQISSNIDMIDNMEMSNYPSLKLFKDPTLLIDTHHVEQSDLLKWQSFISSLKIVTLLSFQKKLCQSSSMDISKLSTYIHLSIDIPSTDISHPLKVTPSMDIPHSSTNVSFSSTVLQEKSVIQKS